MTFIHIFRISFLLVLNLHIGTSIDCYDCSSDNASCGEVPDGDQLIIDGNVASGCPSCVKEFKALGTIWSRITRRCGTSSETEDTCTDVLGYGKCVCTTTFCNSGNSIIMSWTALNLMLFSIFLMNGKL